MALRPAAPIITFNDNLDKWQWFFPKVFISAYHLWNRFRITVSIIRHNPRASLKARLIKEEVLAAISINGLP
jgi:hypothetical protein